MEKPILSLAETAALVGVSKSAIVQAVGRDRLKRRPDQSFDTAAVREFMRGRGKPHSTGRRPRSVKQNRAQSDCRLATDEVQFVPSSVLLQFDTPVRLAQDTGASLQAATAACAIGTGAYNLACLLARQGLPADRLVGIVMQWSSWQRWEWVGGHPEVAESIAESDGWAAAPGGGAWAAHPLFMGDPLSDADWAAVAAIVDACQDTCQDTLAGAGPAI